MAAAPMRPAIEAAFRHGGRDPDTAQARCLDRLAELAGALLARPAWPVRWFRRPAAVPGLYLWGAAGRGKTCLLDALHAALPAGLSRRYHQHRFLDDFHRGAGRGDGFDRRLAALTGPCRLFILDEFHAYDPADAAILRRALAGLVDQGVTLAVSANHRPAELWPKTARQAGGARHFAPLIDLLGRHCRPVELDGGRDYRSLGVRRRWWSPATPAARRQAEAWHAAVDGGRFEFAELCGGRFCHADYAALVDALPGLLLHGLPRFGPGHGDALRRLIWLLDAAWEAGLPLALTAASGPDELFADIGPELRQLLGRDLARTRSRLLGLSALPG